jgi:hypothetical protein
MTLKTVLEIVPIAGYVIKPGENRPVTKKESRSRNSDAASVVYPDTASWIRWFFTPVSGMNILDLILKNLL